jgi:DNA-directed RNA polymerase specialized sigma24 family protein
LEPSLDRCDRFFSSWLALPPIDTRIEAVIQQHHQLGDLAAATTRAIETYGPRLLGYLVGLFEDEEEAAEVFAQVCEDLWRGIGDFGWRSSFWTWAYAVTRNAACR